MTRKQWALIVAAFWLGPAAIAGLVGLIVSSGGGSAPSSCQSQYTASLAQNGYTVPAGQDAWVANCERLNNDAGRTYGTYTQGG